MNKIITIMLGLITGTAYAQGVNGIPDGSMFAPAVSSKAHEIMASMFAGLLNNTEGGNPLLDLIQNINIIAMVVAGILITYQIMNGLIATAHEGEFLGKKLNAATYPLRIAIASAIIVPIKGGYALVQIVVMWLVVQSIGFADHTWISYISSSNFNKSMEIRISSPQSKAMASSILESMVCVESLKKITNKSKDDPMYVEHNWGVFTSKNDTEKTIKFFGDLNQGANFRVDQCGSIEINSPNNLTKDQNNLVDNYAEAKNGIDYVKAKKDGELMAIQAAVVAAHRVALEKLISDISIMANKIVNDDKYQFDGKQLISITNEYNNYMTNFATQEAKRYDVYKSIVEQSKNDGFISSMFIFNKMADLSDVVGRSVLMQSTATKPLVMSNPTYKDQYAIDIMKIDGKLLSSSTSISNTTGEFKNESDASKIKRKIEEKIAEEASGGFFQIYPNEHPIMAAKRIGTNVLGFLFSVSLTLTTVAGVAGGLLGGGFTGATEVMLSAVDKVMVPMWTVGLPLAFFTLIIIPITPMMYILGSVIAWVVSVIEAIVIAPFWAVAHIIHGDDMIGSGERGYKLLLNILLKPVFIVVGVIASFVLITTMTSFIVGNYSNIMSGLSAGSSGIITQVFYWLVSYFIITILTFTIMMSIMKVIFQLPDRVMQWITNSENTLGGSAQDLAGAGSVTGKVATAGAGLAGNIAGKSLQGGAKALKDYSDKQKAQEDGLKNMPGLEKLQMNMGSQNSQYGSKANSGKPDSYNQIKALDDVKNAESQLNGLGAGLGEQFTNFYNKERGEDGNNSDHSTAFKNAMEKTIGSNFDVGSPEGKLLSNIINDPKSSMIGIQALSKLKQFGENRGMLSNDISNSISSFASNVAKETNDFKEGNISEVIGKEYYKTKNSMSGAM